MEKKKLEVKGEEKKEGGGSEVKCDLFLTRGKGAGERGGTRLSRVSVIRVSDRVQSYIMSLYDHVIKTVSLGVVGV